MKALRKADLDGKQSKELVQSVYNFLVDAILTLNSNNAGQVGEMSDTCTELSDTQENSVIEVSMENNQSASADMSSLLEMLQKKSGLLKEWLLKLKQSNTD